MPISPKKSGTHIMKLMPKHPPPEAIREAADRPLSRTDLMTLLTWLSPAFPVGAFSYSHGLESAITTGKMTDAGALRHWIADVLTIGTGWNDAVLFAEAWRAAEASDEARLSAAAELAEALAGSQERHVETMQQGEAFLVAVQSAWPTARLERMVEALGGPAAYSVAVGMASASHDLPLGATLAGYVQAFAANLVSVAVRLVPLGQTRGLQLLANLAPTIGQLADRAHRSTLDDLGSATLLSDIAAMRHESQYSKVFRT
jgi:urease accessory protein